MTMLDDLREQASNPDFFSDEEESFEYSDTTGTKAKPQLFLGMTPIQRFVIAVLILLMVSVMVSFFLLVTERVYFPFY
jgi:hypothetical protein